MGFQIQQRFVLAAIIFVMLGISGINRVGFPLILTQMVYILNEHSNISSNDSNGELICPRRNLYSPPKNVISSSIGDIDNRYQWSQSVQGLILSSMFFGNILIKFPSGILVQKYGGKIVLLASTILIAITLALTPVAVAYGDVNGLIATRIFMGIFDGPVGVAIAAFFIKWFPIEERARTNSFFYLGLNAGLFLTTYLVGLVMHQTNRWDVVFYGSGVITGITGILFAFLCYDTPQSHPFISEKEKEFLIAKTSLYLEMENGNLPPTPWKDMLTNVPVLTLCACTAFYNWANTIVYSGFPKYMNDVLHIPIDINSIYNSIPRIMNMIVSFGSGFLSDWMHQRLNIGLTNLRKLFIALPSILSAVFLIAASYGGCDETLVVILLAISSFGQGFDAVGLDLVACDLGPNYIGPLNSTVFMMSAITTLVAPYVMGALTPHAYLSEWRIVFWLSCSAYLVNAGTFTIWGSAKVQPWNFKTKSIQP